MLGLERPEDADAFDHRSAVVVAAFPVLTLGSAAVGGDSAVPLPMLPIGQVLVHEMIGGQGLQEMEAGIRQLHADRHTQSAGGRVRRDTPVTLEEFHIASVALVVGLALEQVEQFRGQCQGIGIMAGQIVFKEGVQGEGLTVEMLERL